MRYVKISIAVVLLVAMIVFAVQNIESVKVSFIVWSVNAPQVFVILGTYVLGMLTGWGLVEVLKRTLREKSLPLCAAARRCFASQAFVHPWPPEMTHRTALCHCAMPQPQPRRDEPCDPDRVQAIGSPAGVAIGKST